MKKIEKIKELVKELNKHRDAYYNDSKPTVIINTDDEHIIKSFKKNINLWIVEG